MAGKWLHNALTYPVEALTVPHEHDAVVLSKPLPG